jgi:hypothetical protein
VDLVTFGPLTPPPLTLTLSPLRVERGMLAAAVQADSLSRRERVGACPPKPWRRRVRGASLPHEPEKKRDPEVKEKIRQLLAS